MNTNTIQNGFDFNDASILSENEIKNKTYADDEQIRIGEKYFINDRILTAIDNGRGFLDFVDTDKHVWIGMAMPKYNDFPLVNIFIKENNKQNDIFGFADNSNIIKTKNDEKENINAYYSRFRPHLLENTAGTWNFVGSVPKELGYIHVSGRNITEEEHNNIRSFGKGLFKDIKNATWPTKKEAFYAANVAGFNAVSESAAITHGMTFSMLMYEKHFKKGVTYKNQDGWEGIYKEPEPGFVVTTWENGKQFARFANGYTFLVTKPADDKNHLSNFATQLTGEFSLTEFIELDYPKVMEHDSAFIRNQTISEALNNQGEHDPEDDTDQFFTPSADTQQKKPLTFMEIRNIINPESKNKAAHEYAEQEALRVLAQGIEETEEEKKAELMQELNMHHSSATKAIQKNELTNFSTFTDKMLEKQANYLLPKWQEIQLLLQNSPSSSDGIYHWQDIHEKVMSRCDYEDFVHIREEQARRFSKIIPAALIEQVKIHNTKYSYEGKTAEELALSIPGSKLLVAQTDSMIDYSRHKFNSMDYQEQSKYMKKLKRKHIEHRLVAPDNSFHTIPMYVHKYLSLKYPEMTKNIFDITSCKDLLSKKGSSISLDSTTDLWKKGLNKLLLNEHTPTCCCDDNTTPLLGVNQLTLQLALQNEALLNPSFTTKELSLFVKEERLSQMITLKENKGSHTHYPLSFSSDSNVTTDYYVPCCKYGYIPMDRIDPFIVPDIEKIFSLTPPKLISHFEKNHNDTLFVKVELARLFNSIYLEKPFTPTPLANKEKVFESILSSKNKETLHIIQQADEMARGNTAILLSTGIAMAPITEQAKTLPQNTNETPAKTISTPSLSR